MSKTVSTVLSIAALLAAAGSGAAYYFLAEEQLATAMKRSAWIDKDVLNQADNLKDQDNPDYIAPPTDEKTRNGSVFVKRMFKVEQLEKLLRDKREKVVTQRKTIEVRDQTIADRDATIASKNKNIDQLETEKAALTRERDELNSNLSSAKSQVASLTSEREANQAEIQRLNTEMKDEGKYMPRERFDEEVRNKQKAEDNFAYAARKYTELWNWSVVHTSEKMPFPRVVTLGGDAAGNVIPTVRFGNQLVPSKIVTVDIGKGMLALLRGPDTPETVKPGAYFNIVIAGENVGRVKIAEVGTSLVTAEILPGSQMLKLTRETPVELLATQTSLKSGAVVRPANAAPAPAEPVADGVPPPPPPPAN
jgi:predicted  nucleic acid-binding Zn-ribbon protein